MPDAAALFARLALALPNPRCELRHNSAWELLIATILAAQNTDRTVNGVTPVLFARWPDPASLAAAPRDAVEEVIRPTGFFRNKAKAIQETSAAIATRFGGEVPRTLAEVTTLPGVARKTGNVVLGTAYGLQSGFIVDTHVLRLSQRLGLTTETRPEKVETALCALVPQDAWIPTSHRLVLHGRYVCMAKKPDCAACPLQELCGSAEAAPVGTVAERAAAEQVRVDTALDRALALPAP